MIVFCHGMVKSASSFATQITLGLLRDYCNRNSTSMLDLRRYLPESNGLYIDIMEDIDLITQRALEDVGSTLDRILVIKTHGTCTAYLASLVAQNDVIAFSTYRNPVDIALSLCDAARLDEANGKTRFTHYASVEDAIPAIDWQIACFQSWAAAPGVELISFDELASSPYMVGERIAKRLGIDWHSEPVQFLVENKRQIWEFNKGAVNRGVKELDPAAYTKLTDYWHEFISFVSRK